ncbi:MAG TPA: hypothetical protein VK640_12010 [Actinomycetes bacterium]|nr:hypothetical protein [Actinomycetes bacterium]
MTSEFSGAGTSDLAQSELHGVWLRRYPLRLGVRASEHYESVYRELALLASSEQGSPVPGTLLELLEEMDRRSARNNASEQVRDEALARGEDSLDIELHVPPDVVEVAQRVEQLLEEADAFCRDGTLLTLEPSSDVVAFRRWYIGELARQVAGEAPESWPGELR